MNYYQSNFLWTFFSQKAFVDLLKNKRNFVTGRDWMVKFLQSIIINYYQNADISVYINDKGFYINFEQQRLDNSHLHVSFHVSHGNSPTHIKISECKQDFNIVLFNNGHNSGRFDIVYVPKTIYCPKYNYVIATIRIVLIEFLNGLLDSQIYKNDFKIIGNLIGDNKIYKQLGLMIHGGNVSDNSFILSSIEIMFLLPYIRVGIDIALTNVLPIVDYLMLSGLITDITIKQLNIIGINKLIQEVINSKNFVKFNQSVNNYYKILSEFESKLNTNENQINYKVPVLAFGGNILLKQKYCYW
jgi:hypothetical protein